MENDDEPRAFASPAYPADPILTVELPLFPGLGTGYFNPRHISSVVPTLTGRTRLTLVGCPTEFLIDMSVAECVALIRT